MGEEVRKLPCNHLYHSSCILPWLMDMSRACPMCKQEVIFDAGPEGTGNRAGTGQQNDRTGDVADGNERVDEDANQGEGEGVDEDERENSMLDEADGVPMTPTRPAGTPAGPRHLRHNNGGGHGASRGLLIDVADAAFSRLAGAWQSYQGNDGAAVGGGAGSASGGQRQGTAVRRGGGVIDAHVEADVEDDEPITDGDVGGDGGGVMGRLGMRLGFGIVIPPPHARSDPHGNRRSTPGTGSDRGGGGGPEAGLIPSSVSVVGVGGSRATSPASEDASDHRSIRTHNSRDVGKPSFAMISLRRRRTEGEVGGGGGGGVGSDDGNDQEYHSDSAEDPEAPLLSSR